MSTEQTDLPSSHEQDGKESRSTPAETKETPSVHNSAEQAPQHVKSGSDLDRMERMSDEDLKKIGFPEANTK